MFLRRRNTVASSDEDLVLAIRGGHPSALGDLWDRYAHLLFGVGMKYLKNSDEARDTVVELFTALPELLRKHEVERFRPWVHTVMRNRCLMALRKDHRSTAIPEELAQAMEQDAEETRLHEATLQQLERAIETLNTAQRDCIRHFHLERQSYQRTAELTGYTIEQVRSHLQNGRRNLAIYLNRHADQNA